jgi:transposase InsO family protein
MADVEELTFDWNYNRRPHIAPGNLPPEEFQLAYYDEINAQSRGASAHITAA